MKRPQIPTQNKEIPSEIESSVCDFIRIKQLVETFSSMKNFATIFCLFVCCLGLMAYQPL